MSGTCGTAPAQPVSITLRGKTVSWKPLTLGQAVQAYDDIRAVMHCTGTDPFASDMFPHIIRILAISIRKHFPHVPVPALADDLMEAIHPMDLLYIVPVVFRPDKRGPYFSIPQDLNHGIQ